MRSPKLAEISTWRYCTALSFVSELLSVCSTRGRAGFSNPPEKGALSAHRATAEQFPKWGVSETALETGFREADMSEDSRSPIHQLRSGNNKDFGESVGSDISEPHVTRKDSQPRPIAEITFRCRESMDVLSYL